MPPSPLWANREFPRRKVGLSSEQTSTFLGGKSEPPFQGVSGMMQTEHHVFDICLQITHLQLGVRPQDFNFGPGPR